MNKILLIIQREYITRVKKKSFWIATILAPILITAIYAIPALLFLNNTNTKTVEVIDESGLFTNKFKDEKGVSFKFSKQPLEKAKKEFLNSKFDALVYIPGNIVDDAKGVRIFAEKNVNLSLQGNIEGTIQSELRNIKLTRAGIDVKVIEDNKIDVSANTFSLSEDGGEKSSSAGGTMILGAVLGFILYITVFLYGSQVMNGVIEEKSNRIIELMISSVKPYQLMMGKIVGIGMVGMTQFLLWIVLTFSISTVTSGVIASRFENQLKKEIKIGATKEEIKKTETEIKSQNPMAIVDKVFATTSIPKLILCFLFFYLGGYLLYSSLFAAVGSAVENSTEAQQFMFPVTIPIIISFFLAQYSIQEPDSQTAFWASIIPFTSPINMMVRLPFGVPAWELLLSMVLLVLGFMGTTWLAGRIYRVGILMYGKKMTWKEVSKWVFYKG